MLEWVGYILAYFLAGFTLKLGDDLLDEHNKENLAWFPFAVSGLLFGFLMSLSEWDLVLFTAIIVGVLFSGKVNKPQFLIGFVLIIIIVLIQGIPDVTDWLEWLTILCILFFAAVLDEKGNDWVDTNSTPRAAQFFAYRFSLKCSVLFISVIWPLFVPSAIGLWVFDIGYEGAGWISRHQISQSEESKTAANVSEYGS
jgi:uncharacterized membrane protein